MEKCYAEKEPEVVMEEPEVAEEELEEVVEESEAEEEEPEIAEKESEDIVKELEVQMDGGHLQNHAEVEAKERKFSKTKEEEVEGLLSKIEVEKLTAKNVIRTIICGIVVLGIAIAMVIVGASARIDFIAEIGSLMPCGGLYWFLFRMGSADFSEWMKANKEKIEDIDKYIKKNSEFARRLYYEKCRKKYLLEYMNRLNPDVVKSIKDSKRIRMKDEKKEIPTMELKFVNEPSEEQIQEMVRKRNEILKQMGYTFDENGKFYKPPKKD